MLIDKSNRYKYYTIKSLAFILLVLITVACRSKAGKPDEEKLAYDFIIHIIETNACPQLDQPYILDSAGWNKPVLSPMYSSIIEKWFTKEDLRFLIEQQVKHKSVKLDSNLFTTKKLLSKAELRKSNISYSHLSYPLFNKTYDVCLIKAGYKVSGLASGSAMYIFKKFSGVWSKVEMFDVSM